MHTITLVLYEELGVHVFASFFVCAHVSFPSLKAGIGKLTVACRFPTYLPCDTQKNITAEGRSNPLCSQKGHYGSTLK